MKFDLIFLLFLLTSFYECLGFETINSDLVGPIVRLPYGTVEGSLKKSYRNRTFAAFEGIPYAEPPVGNLRFKEPKPIANWNYTLKADKHYECLHFMPFPGIYGPRGTEDCLYLYIYVPRETINSSELLDVIVHIHGGGFMIGAPKYMAGPQYLMDRDAVVVSLNYRLGILGFLSTEDRIVPGNNGLKDQSLALQWIKSNIRYFGGNPASITITGLSAGAASVHFHYFSALSKGLFHRGFSQSGTALQCWSLAERPLEKARTVARNVSCPISTNEEMVDCLRTVEAKKLINGIKPLFVYMEIVPFAPFGPVIEKDNDGAFLTEHPYKLLQEKRVYDVPWITSNTREEGLFPVGFIAASNKFKEIDDKWYDIMQYALELHYTVELSKQKDVMSKIKSYYFHDKPISLDNMYSFVGLFTDRMFLLDAEKAIRMQSKATKSEVYYYMYSYVVKMPHFPPGMPKGAVHGDDGRLLFKMFLSPSRLGPEDEEMMDYFLDFITSFAKTGVPTMKLIDWLPIKPEGQYINYLQIEDADNIKMVSIPKLASDDFWNNLPINEGENAVTDSAIKINSPHFLFVILITLVIANL